MKRNKGHITLSILLLALMLVGRVGLHLFHHHDSAAHYEIAAAKKSASGIVLLSAEAAEAADCALCKLDTFQELVLNSIALFVFFLVIIPPVYRFLLTEFSQFSFFTNNRGPPGLLFSVL